MKICQCLEKQERDASIVGKIPIEQHIFIAAMCASRNASDIYASKSGKRGK
jgi:hypothetical protein